MIPAQDIEVDVPSPLPEAGMPDPEEVGEEGFGGFRDTWHIGHVGKADLESILREEAELMRIVDAVAATPDEFEELASAIEGCDLESLSKQLREAAMKEGLAACVDGEIAPLDGLELGVAGLAYALGSVGCLTAASCRWHTDDRSWSDVPVVFFAAPQWRLELLADMIAAAGCGLVAGRGMLEIVAPSIRNMHALAEMIAAERKRFRRKPDHWRTPSDRRRRLDAQLELPLDKG
jgi:hypothetical protein